MLKMAVDVAAYQLNVLPQVINDTPSDKDVFVSVSGNHEWRSKNNSGKYKFHSIFKNAPSFEREEKTETGQRFFLWYSGKCWYIADQERFQKREEEPRGWLKLSTSGESIIYES